MENVLEQIGSLLRRRIGLNPLTLGPHGLASAVRARMTACNVANAGHYLRHLGSQEGEFQELIEEVTVLESWFFRDLQPFECLRWFARENKTAGPLRVLSVPCGPGEETYSLALTLFDLGWLPEAFSVKGIDLSRRALARAQEGLYGPRSFRETAVWIAPLCRRYLLAEGANFRAGPELRATVQFSPGNLTDPFFLAGQSPVFEVIFCRNLLIYLTEEARATALTNLHRLLAPGGMLYVGHAEARVSLDPRFVPLHPLYPFAFSTASSPLPASRDKVSALTSEVPVLKGEGPFGASRETPGSQPALSHPSSPPGRERGLSEAREAADAGRLQDAAELCERLVRDGQPSAEALCLLGVIRQAQGDRIAAARYFHQAVYLDPGHQEALVHLALLAEGDGDAARAALYRRRAARTRSGD